MGVFPVSCSLNPTDPCQVCAARHWAEAFDVVKSGKGPVLQGGSGVDRTGRSDGPVVRVVEVALLGTGSERER